MLSPPFVHPSPVRKGFDSRPGSLTGLSQSSQIYSVSSIRTNELLSAWQLFGTPCEKCTKHPDFQRLSLVSRLTDFSSVLTDSLCVFGCFWLFEFCTVAIRLPRPCSGQVCSGRVSAFCSLILYIFANPVILSKCSESGQSCREVAIPFLPMTEKLVLTGFCYFFIFLDKGWI